MIIYIYIYMSRMYVHWYVVRGGKNVSGRNRAVVKNSCSSFAFVGKIRDATVRVTRYTIENPRDSYVIFIERATTA